MDTLVEFVRFTKGWEYVIAISAVFSFGLFWWLVAREAPVRVKKTVAEKRARGVAAGAPAPRGAAREGGLVMQTRVGQRMDQDGAKGRGQVAH